RYELKALSLPAAVVQTASGDHHTLVRLANGTVWAWGVNASGQLGDGTSSTSMSPVQVPGLSNVVAVAADASTSLAIKSDGTVWAWGANTGGQLADGTTNPSAVPVQITGVGGIITADVGLDHIIARKNDGTVWIWGNNDQGQLLSGGAAVLAPTQVPGLSTAVDVAAGSGFSLVRHANGTVSSWGFNDYGQLGHGDVALRTSPVTVAGLSAVSEIAAGTAHSLVRLQDGTLRAWGNNELGQLGDATFTNRLSPVTVKRLSGVQRIAAGFLHSLAVRADGTVWTWGNNGNEQLAVSVRHEHRPAIRLVADAGDSGQRGVTDAWLMNHFGTIFHDVTVDSDLDGWSDIQEHVLGTDPTVPDTTGNGFDDIADPDPLDFYSGASPTLAIVSGNNQFSAPSQFLPQGITLEVRDAAGQLLKKAPVSITITTGGGRLAPANTGVSLLFTTLDLKTDANGRLVVYYKQGPALSVSSTLTFTAGGTSVTAQATTITDTDGDGMPDNYETAMGLNPNAGNGTGHQDGDGIPNNEDARPNDSGVGRLSISITTPATGSTIP
ncbi:MAG: repeat domain protein, partial [Rariglobus sp.]|nr:repeat domain protein [Rariglobus sp.]